MPAASVIVTVTDKVERQVPVFDRRLIEGIKGTPDLFGLRMGISHGGLVVSVIIIKGKSTQF